jgi:CDP-4-dehydro-6-deoxyglucose reductase
VSRNVHEGTVVAITPLARGVVEWRLRTPEPLVWRPGQFISVRVGLDEDQNPILRSYSIANAPGSHEVALVLKIVPGGAGSAFFERLSVGDNVQFTGPMGFFVLELSHPGDVIFGATGVGIAPVKPMIEELLARPETGRIDVFWGNRDGEDMFWERELSLPRVRLWRYLTGSVPEGWTGARGRITEPLVEAARGAAHPTVYLVGNGKMIREARPLLVAAGLERRRQIRTEQFFD